MWRAVRRRAYRMGAPQIMGFNYGMIGYDAVQDMCQACQDERFQILGSFDFIRNGAGQAAVYGAAPASMRKHSRSFSLPESARVAKRCGVACPS